MRPNAGDLYLPDADYLRLLCEGAGISPRQAAKQIGIGERVMRYYLTPAVEGADSRIAPYPVQFALEALACSDCRRVGTITSVSYALEAFPVLAYMLERIGQLRTVPVREGGLNGHLARVRNRDAFAVVGRSLVSRFAAAGYLHQSAALELVARFNAAQGIEPPDSLD